MKPIIKFAAEQDMSPTAKAILREAVRIVYPDGVRMEPVEPGPGVIGFGLKGNGMIRCISPNQIATAPNAVSAVVDALRLYKDGVNVPQLDYRVLDTIDEFAKGLYLLTLRYDHPTTVDIEWAKDKSMLSLAVSWTDGQMVFPEEYVQPGSLRLIAEALAQNYYIIGHNWKSDAGVILDHVGVKIPVWFDTMLAHHTLYMAATGQHGLKEMAESMLGIPDWDTKLHEYTGKGDKADYGLAPRDMLYKYNAYDVLYTQELARRLIPQVGPDFWHETHAANMLIDVEANRLKIDVPYIEQLAVEFDKQIEEAMGRLPEGLNPNSPKQVKDYFLSEGLDLPDTTKDTLEEHEEYPAVANILAVRRAKKLKSTYGTAYLNAVDENGFLRASWNVHGTSTGRLSSSKPFNAQNVPRDNNIRRIFTSRGEGYLIGSCDYAQAELRVMACLSKDEAMMSLFQVGSPDFFDALMPMVYPSVVTTVEEYEAFHEANPKEAKEMRTALKSVVYGLGFGRQAEAIGHAIGMSEDEAQGIIDYFLDSFPSFKQWRIDVMAAAIYEGDRDLLTTPFGRRFNSEIITHRNRQNVINAGLAFLPQSTASDLCVQAAVWANNKFRTEGWDAKIISLVHDNILIDAHESVVEEACDVVQSLMRESGRQIFQDLVIFDTDKEIGPTWGDLK